MKRNLLFSQTTALGKTLGKRLAMVLTMLLIVGIGQAWATEVIFTTSESGGWTTTAGAQSGTIDGVTLAVTNGIINGNQLRCYANATMTISSDHSITNIEITCTASGTSNYGPGKFSGTGYTYLGTTGTWAGSSNSVSLKASAQVRMTKIVVTYTAGGGTGGSGDDSGDDSGDGECTWQLVTDASTLKAGDRVVIAAKDYNFAMSTDQKSNNRGQTAITKNGNTITSPSNSVQILTLNDGKSAGTLAFNTGSGYLYAASSSDNYLRTEKTLTANSSWKITISNSIATIVAQGSYTRNTMQYNQSSSLFACYSSASQKALAIYKEVCTGGTTEPTVFVIPKCGGMVAARG